MGWDAIYDPTTFVEWPSVPDVVLCPYRSFDIAVRVGELPDSGSIARQLAPCRTVVCGRTELT